MIKQIIFNVGGALSSYIECNNHKILVDLGSSSDFHPIKDFLLPLYISRNESRDTNGKYSLSQLILSHPHNDHISDIEEFHKNFYPSLITIPNDNVGTPNAEKINWSLIDNPSDDYVSYLRKNVLPGRRPPLCSIDSTILEIFYNKCLQCENSPKLDKKNYANNISIATFLFLNGQRILMAGDIMKDGMAYIIANNQNFANELIKGVDFLIAPHHGLKSSFSTELFDKMKNKKTNRLNIISEKPTSSDSNRIVDSRYSISDFCSANNNLSTSTNKVCQRKTSGGHIIIDYSSKEPVVTIENSNKDKDLIKYFI
ncbi:MAG: MBL fold metallo-hydrolase [Bacteroidota bacterium]